MYYTDTEIRDMIKGESSGTPFNGEDSDVGELEAMRQTIKNLSMSLRKLIYCLLYTNSLTIDDAIDICRQHPFLDREKD